MRRILASIVAGLGLCVASCTPMDSAPPAARDASSAPLAAESAAATVGTRTSAMSPQVLRPTWVPGELLVKFRSKSNSAVVLRKSGARSVQSFKALPGLNRVRLGKGANLQASLEALRAMPEVEYAEPNYFLYKNATPNDPLFSQQWALNNTGQTGGATDYDINAPEGWNVRSSAAGVVVAVIDSGIDYNHEDLAANIWSNPSECSANGIDDDANGYIDDCHGIDPADGDSDPMDDEGHGTHVAGIIGAVGNNGVGIAGVAWNVKLLPCKFLTQAGDGSTADAIACLDYVAALKDRGVNIVATNNSWGSYAYSQALRDAVAGQRDRGIVFVAAAGNDAVNIDFNPEYPCSFDLGNVICVGSMLPVGLMDPASNYGIFSVHLSAPGGQVLSTLPGNQYGESSGTSMAAPHITGEIALLAAQDPARSGQRNRNLILSSGYYDYQYASFRNITFMRAKLDASLGCTSQVTKARIAPDWNSRQVHRAGVPIDLGVLHVKCGVPNGNVSANVSPGGLTLTLLDNGQGADEIAGDGVYSVRWTPTVAGTYTVTFPGSHNDTFTVVVDEHIKPGFPVRQTIQGGSYSLPIYLTVGNISGDEKPEIVATSIFIGPTYVWNSDGSAANGWPIRDADGYIVARGVGYSALAELDGDPSHSELAVAYYGGDVYAYGPNATVLPGWPQRTISTQEVSDPTVAGDIDGDGRDEIFVYDLGTELIYRHDGTRMPGWAPIESGIPNIADLDGDELPEIVTATVPLQGITTHVRAMHADGSSLPGFPIDLGVTVSSSTLVGDIDGDGHNEILLVSNIGIRKVTDTGAVSVLVPQLAESPSKAVASLADLDGDGIPEIVMLAEVSTNTYTQCLYLYAFKGDGTALPGFPFNTGGGPCLIGDFAPVIGDIDGDQQPDILYGSANIGGTSLSNIYAVNRSGTMINGFPKQVYGGSGGNPAIADLDLNGRNDIIINGQDWLTFIDQDNVWVYELPGPPHGRIEWGQFQGDSKHQGYYQLGKNLPAHAFLSTRVRGSGRITATGINCGTDCIEKVSKGASVTLTATGTGGHAFAGWLGACAGQANPCTVAISRYTSVVARFDDGVSKRRLSVVKAGTGSGTITSSFAGIQCPGDCSEDFYQGAKITLTATAAAGSYFAGWTGVCADSPGGNSCEVTMDVARTVGASFEFNDLLQVSINGPGKVTSVPAGIDCGQDCEQSFQPGSQVVLTATPQTGAYFQSWIGACSGSTPTCTVSVNGLVNVTASFASAVTINVTRAGNGTGRVTSEPDGIDCGTDCTGLFIPGSSVTLHAEPAVGSRFGGWGGGCSDVLTICSYQLNVSGGASLALNITFIARETLTVTTTSGGSVSSNLAGISCGSDCTEDYDRGATVVLTAAASAGSTFTGWSGACSGTASTCNVTLDQARNAGATFAANPPSNNPGGGSSSGGGGGGGGGRLDLMLLLAFAGLTLLRLRRGISATGPGDEHNANQRGTGYLDDGERGGRGARAGRLA